MTFRVTFGRWQAGGQLVAEHVDVDASSADEAIRQAKRMDRARSAGRSRTGYFHGATAEQVAVPGTKQAPRA